MRRTRAWVLAGSPPSSPRIRRTGCPLSPPRAVTWATQARAPWKNGAIVAPRIPLWTPNDPSRISAPVAPPPAPAPAPGAAGGAPPPPDPAAVPAAPRAAARVRPLARLGLPERLGRRAVGVGRCDRGLAGGDAGFRGAGCPGRAAGREPPECRVLFLQPCRAGRTPEAQPPYLRFQP